MSATSTDFIPILLSAVADQEAGRLDQAAAGFAAVLALEPDQPQALMFGGVLALRRGETEQAVRLLEAASMARPDFAEAHFAFGNALWAAGRGSDARMAWQHAIRADPQHVGALLNLAQAQERCGDADLAVLHCRAATAARPNHPQTWTALASALRTLPDPAGALECADHALTLDPGYAPAHHQRGMVLKALARSAEAAKALRTALEHQPAAAPTHLNLANLLHDLGDLRGAEYHCRTALALDPAAAEAYAVLGFLKIQTGDLAAAIAACERAIAISPELSEAHCNLGIALLSAGNLPAGFARYEWRKRHPVYGKEFFSQESPEWTGQAMAGKRVAIMAEQGLGDAIMFARYAAVLAAQGATVLIACDRRLVPLLQTAPGVTRAVAKTRHVDECDFWVDQMSLPLLCGTTADTVPSPGPYLAADPARTAKWAGRLGLPSGCRRVGIVWAGNPLHDNDANRSCPAELFRPLLARPGIAGVSLQVGAAAKQANALGLVDWSADLTDYAETAGLVANLDLVITVDTSVAHLAAAMGKPTWVMLPEPAEWRWMRDRADTPWYDCMRLFRHQSPGDWSGTHAAILAAFDSTPA